MYYRFRCNFLFLHFFLLLLLVAPEMYSAFGLGGAVLGALTLVLCLLSIIGRYYSASIIQYAVDVHFNSE